MDWADDVSSRDGQPGHKAGKANTVCRKRAEHQSAVQGVHWCERGQYWQANWYDKGDGKQERKRFSVKEHGFHKAKELAEHHRLEMERNGRAVVKKRSKHQSGVRGVSYSEGYKSWVAEWRKGGRRKTKAFSVKQLGYEEAKQAAIAHRREMEQRHHTSEGGATRDESRSHNPPNDDDDDEILSPRRHGPPSSRPDLGGMEGGDLAAALVEVLSSDGSCGLCWQDGGFRVRLPSSEGEDGEDRIVDVPVVDLSSRSAVIAAFRRAVEELNRLSTASEGGAAAPLDISWLDDISPDGCDRPRTRRRSGARREPMPPPSLSEGPSDRPLYNDDPMAPHIQRRRRHRGRSSPRVSERPIADSSSSENELLIDRPAAKRHREDSGGERERCVSAKLSEAGGNSLAASLVEQAKPQLADLNRDDADGQQWSASRPEGSTRGGSSDHNPSRKQRRRHTALASRSPSTIEGRIGHRSGVKSVSYDKRHNSWVARWKEGGSRKSKHFMVESLGFEGAKEAAIAHRRRKTERLHTSEGGAKRHGDQADSRSADDGDDPLPVKQRQAPQLRDGGVGGGVLLHPTARRDTNRPRRRRDDRFECNPSPADIEAPSWLREGPPATPPTHHTASRGPRVSPVQRGHLIRHFYQQLEALGRAHPDTPLCLRFRSGSALPQLAVEVVLPGTPVQSVPLSAATREAMGAAVDAAWACRQQEMDIDSTEDQQPMIHAQRMVLCRLYGQVGHNIGAMLAAVPSLSFASIDLFVRHGLPAMVGQRDGEDLKEAASRFIKQLHHLGNQHTTPAMSKRLKAADDEQLPSGHHRLADIDMTMRPPLHQRVNDPHPPNVPQERDPNEADRMADGELVELLKAHPSPDMRHLADSIMGLEVCLAVSLLDMLDDIDSVAAGEDIGRDLGLHKGIALVIIVQLRRFLQSLKRRGAVQWPPGDGVMGEGSLAAGQLWDSGRLVSAVERSMGVMAADKKERHGDKLQHVIDNIKEYGISGMSMSLLVEPPQDSGASDDGRVEAALIDAARETVFGGISDVASIRRTINRQDE
ncbi:unnamed protein product [Vitrella brassicaformis CCMP3155]|uniref:AP2/ERF domain-containing protein n=1 Tax=Vitrella brassicaformis (strain CCMP3155) TaxID=1169540 RepID=A0A0G4EQY4_VITBC|nr:unnamed protein product [Vitrella brassicaformis CCMP3155]|eukprot:CEL99861.1 unnamed protein product [Vitrella brassicaformis CCMP3155]